MFSSNLSTPCIKCTVPQIKPLSHGAWPKINCYTCLAWTLKPILVPVSWKKKTEHSPIPFLPMAPLLLLTSPLFTPLTSVLCRVCILQVQSTVFLSLGSVSMSLHLICIRFSTLSGSYLIPTEYSAEGNWVLRPEERERSFWWLFKFITVFCSGLDGARLAAQGHRGVCYSNKERGGRGSLANHAATAIQGLFSSPHFNTTCLIVETAREQKYNEHTNVPASYCKMNSQWWQVETLFWFFKKNNYLKNWHEPLRFELYNSIMYKSCSVVELMNNSWSINQLVFWAAHYH